LIDLIFASNLESKIHQTR